MGRAMLENDVLRAKAEERLLRTGDARTEAQIKRDADYLVELQQQGAQVWSDADWVRHDERMSGLRRIKKLSLFERIKKAIAILASS